MSARNRCIAANPYTNRGAISNPDQFFGREREIRDIYTRVRGGQSVSLIGERRVGKSSLLNAVGFEREQYGMDEFDFVFMDMQSIAGCSEEAFLRDLLHLVSRETGLKPREPRRESLDLIAAELHSARRALIVAIDEFDVLIRSEKISPEFLVFLRSWTIRYRFPFVVAFREGSLDRIVEHEKFGSAFLNVFGSLYVGPLDETEALDLIREPAARCAVEFDEEDTEAVLDLAGFLPLYIQIACFHLFNFKQDGRSLESARQALEERFAFDARDHLAYLWAQLPDPEKDALRSWIKFGGSKDALAEKELRRKGILVEQQRAMRLFSSVLEGFVQRWDNAPKTIVQQVRDSANSALK